MEAHRRPKSKYTQTAPYKVSADTSSERRMWSVIVPVINRKNKTLVKIVSEDCVNIHSEKNQGSPNIINISTFLLFRPAAYTPKIKTIVLAVLITR